MTPTLQRGPATLSSGSARSRPGQVSHCRLETPPNPTAAPHPTQNLPLVLALWKLVPYVELSTAIATATLTATAKADTGESLNRNPKP